MMKYLIIAAASISLITGCLGCSGIEHSEATDEVTEARLDGRRAARKLIHQQWSDSSELRKNYREIIVMRDSITPELREVFDSTFISTRRAVEPNLASAIDRGWLKP